jgi:hypothetical protein
MGEQYIRSITAKKVVNKACRWSSQSNPVHQWESRSTRSADDQTERSADGKARHSGGKSINDWQQVKVSFRRVRLLHESFSFW